MSNEQVRPEAPLPQRNYDYPSVSRFSRGALKKDREHLRLLAIFHYVCAGLYALLGLIPCIHVFAGILMVSGAMGPPPKGPPPELGFLFIGIGSVVILLAETMAICIVVAGRSLAQHKRYVFCFAIAILLCLGGVPGIVLGIFTILVLVRDSVKELFTHGEAAFGLDHEED